MNLKERFKVNLSLLTAAGLILRLMWIVNVKSAPISDFSAYQDIAVSVFKNEYNNFLGFQGPGYPFVLGWFYKLVGSTDIFGAKVFNLILSVLTMIIILKILIVLFQDKRIIFFSYAGVLFMPNYIAYNSILGTETLYLFLFSLIVLLQISNKNSMVRYILLGVVTGLAALVKPYMIIYPVIAMISFWLKNKEVKKAIVFFAAVQIACLCVIIPWTYRNYKVYKEFIPISFNDGYVMYINNNDQNKGVWIPLTDVKMTDETLKTINDAGYTYDQATTLFNTKLNKVFKEEAIKWIKRNPEKFTKLALIRTTRTFFGGSDDVFSWAVNEKGFESLLYTISARKALKQFSSYIVILLSASGIVFILRNAVPVIKAVFIKGRHIGYEISIPVLNIAFSVMLSVVYEGQPRYNFSLLFLFSICLCTLIFRYNSQGDIIRDKHGSI